MKILRTLICALALGWASAAGAATATAIFAGGCFWCTESDFEKLPGVVAAVSGYTGGTVEHPTYAQSNTGKTGHTEAVEVSFDPAKVSYAELVEYFWHHHDPLDGGGQFCDRGSQYRPAIFYADEAQRRIAEASRAKVAARFDQPIRTEITKATTFWPAEAYHQDYYKKNALRYEFYRLGCGRDARIDELWKQARR